MPTVLITPERMRNTSGPHLDVLQQAGFEIRYPRDPLLARGRGTDEETIAELQGIHATLASTENYSQKVLSALPDLKVIARTGVGYDRVDVPAATEHRVAVCITPNSNHEAVAELALALLFAVSKSMVLNDRRVRAGEWPREVLAPIRGRTLGVFGMGRIGKSTAVRAKALGMRVVATEKYPDLEFIQQHNIELFPFEEMLAVSDYISIHAPLNEDTRACFNRDTFAKMKPGSVLINTARGPLVCEADLYEALTSGHLAGAGLDVFEQEPPQSDHPLFQLENVVLSPHMAGADHTSAEAMGREAAECIVRLYNNEWPDGAVVNTELKEDWQWTS